MNNNVVSNNPPNHSHQNSPITNGGTPGNDVSQHQQHPVYTHNMSGSGQQDHHSSQYSLPQHRIAQRDGPALITLPAGTRVQTVIADSAQVANAQQQQDLAAAMYGIYQQPANNPQTGYPNMHQSGYANPQLATSGGHYFYSTATPYYATNTATGYPQTLIMQQPHQAAAAYQILSQSQIPSSTHATQQLISSGGNVGQHQNVNVSLGMPVTSVSMSQSNVVTSSGCALPSTIVQPSTQTQPMKPRKILQIVNPDSGESLKFGSETKPATSVGSSAASDEEKSTVVKTDFFRKVAERAHESAALPPQQINRRSPSSSGGAMISNEAMHNDLLDQQRQQQITGSIPIIQKGGSVTTGFTETTQPSQIPYLSTTSASIPIEHPTMPILHQHSPHNLPSILELKVKNPSPKKDEEHFKFTRTSPALLIEEQRSRFHESDEDGKRFSNKDNLSGQELNGGTQSLSPIDMNADAKTSEEKINELEEELASFDGIRDETHDPDEMIYNRPFLMFLRKVTQAIKIVECPRTEQELEDLGLSKKGMIVNQLSGGPKLKRFEMAGGDFKPSWQQQGGIGNTQFGGNTQFSGNTQFGGGSRFGSRPPNYVGRHSDNKLKPKKGPIICRPSLDQRPIKLDKNDTLPKKSANAWKSKREERFDMNAPVKDEEEIKHEKIKKEVRGLLNKITPSSYQELSDEFCAYKFVDDTKLLTPIIDLIFDKAVEEPHFCPLYSDLCKKQVDVERQIHVQRDKTPDKQQDQSDKQIEKSEKPKEKSFRTEIISKSQRTFLASDEYDKKMKELEVKLTDADDKTKIIIEEELETRRSKEKRRLLGIVKFIGQLYRHHLLIESIIDWCAYELVKRYQNTNDEVYIEYAVELIETVGKIYQQRTESESFAFRQQMIKTSQATSQEFALDNIVSHLCLNKNTFTNRVRFAIMDLEDLKKNRWMPRGGEKGPKTIDEVREEVEKEQHVNEMERLEYEKSKDKVQLLRKPQSGRTGYGGRSSADRRQAAAANTMLRDTKTESRISSARLVDIDKESVRKPAWRKDNSSNSGGPSTTGGGGDS